MNQYIDSKKYDEAVIIYRKAVGVNPEFVDIYHEFKEKLNDEDTSKAIAATIKNIADSSYKELGKRQRENQKYTEAILTYRKALKLSPGNPDIIDALANTYTQRGDSNDFNKAKQVYLKSVNQYIDSKKYDEAVIIYRKAVGVNPEFVDIYHEFKEKLNDEDTSKAIAATIKNIADSSYKELGKRQRENQKYTEAILTYRKALELSPGNPDIIEALVITYIQRGHRKDFDWAAEAYLKAIRTDSANAKIYDKLTQELKNKEPKEASKFYNILGNKLKNDHRFDEAIQQYEKAVDLDTKNYDAFDSLTVIFDDSADTYREQEQYDQAIKAFTKAIKWAVSDSVKSRLNNSRGLMHWKQGKIDSAKSDFRTAMSLDSGYSAPRYNLAGVLLAEDSLRQALQVALQAKKLAPDWPPYWDRLAEIYSSIGNNNDAKRAKDKAKQLRKERADTKN